MEDLILCPTCHVEVRQTDYFCFNCGRNLKPKPPSTTLPEQVKVYLKSFLLPPIGLVIGIRYLRQKDIGSKFVGIIAIILTFVSIIIVIKLTSDLVNILNSQINNQLQMFEGL